MARNGCDVPSFVAAQAGAASCFQAIEQAVRCRENSRQVGKERYRDGQNETVPSFASYDGTEIGYRLLGAGPPLVCLPGGPGRAAEYLGDPPVPARSSASHRREHDH